MNNRNVPIWLQVVAILLFGVILSVLSYNAVVWAKADKYTVTFAYQDGTVIAKKQVRDGYGVIPAELETNYVFRGWSAAINCVVQDIEVHPLLFDIADSENLFYFDSVYVREGEYFTLDLMLAGAVSFNSAQLILEYDHEVMQYVGSKQSHLCSVSDNQDGTLTITVGSEDLISKQSHLTKLKFKALEKDVQSTDVILRCAEIYITSNGESKPTIGTTLNNKVYYLQKTGRMGK